MIGRRVVPGISRYELNEPVEDIVYVSCVEMG